jgi:hypothetical protein
MPHAMPLSSCHADAIRHSYMPVITCHIDMLHATCYSTLILTPHATCYMHIATRYIATRYMPHYYMLHVDADATCYMLHAIMPR